MDDAFVATAAPSSHFAATVMLSDEFAECGIRSASSFDTMCCPFGHCWLIGHTIEAVSPQEMQRRYSALFTNSAAPTHGD